MTDEKIVEIYYDHYKDTFSHLKDYISIRDKIFYATLGVLVLVFFQSNNPDVTKEVSVVLIKKNLGSEISININFINSLLLFLFLSLTIRYFQANTNINRQYDYIHKIEAELTSKFGVNISREGTAYLDGYPIVLSAIHRIYTIIFPIILLAVIVAKFRAELNFFGDKWLNGYFIFDSSILLLLVVLTLMYSVWDYFARFFKKFRRQKFETNESGSADLTEPQT
jgi:hypothetical protein